MEVVITGDAGTMYQISGTLSGGGDNVYTIYGTVDSPISVPASYHEAAPFAAGGMPFHAHALGDGDGGD
eukprot:SAG11_NODE_28113_length_325_cov_0.907080_1_plen_68_part_10